jgi:tRNA pseudouridine13 synthase
MKVKYRLDDFIVEEILKPEYLISKEKGDFAVLRIKKKNLTTFSLIEIISKKFQIPKYNLYVGGLKDKYSIATQYMSVKIKDKGNIPPKSFSSEIFEFQRVGFSNEPLSFSKIYRNRFNIILRNICKKDIGYYKERLSHIELFGYPNYFDDQRFGSARHNMGFIGKEIIKQNYKRGLELFLCYYSNKDKSKMKRFKKLSKENWGNWALLLPSAPTYQERAVLKFLVEHPDRYLEALKRLGRRFLRFLLEAYQSYLWNRTLETLMKDKISCTNSYPYSVSTFVFPKMFNGDEIRFFQDLKIPFLNSRNKIETSFPEVKDTILDILSNERLTLESFKLKRKVGLSLGGAYRNAWIIPENLVYSIVDDEFHEDRVALRSAFDLPSGSYATILIKCITPCI